jgi:hypothetical protein
LPTPRGLSQAPTSFIGSWYQDIHRLPLVACHNNKQQKTKLRYKEMLASTIQFSKYGQKPNPNHHLSAPQTSIPGKQHTQNKHPHQRFGESRPQPPTTPTPNGASVAVTQKKQSNLSGEKKARFLRTQQRASAPHPHLTHVPRVPSEEDQQY